MVAAIVARELLVSGLRLAAVERGVVIAARDLGKLKTWSQAVAAAIGGFAAAGAGRPDGRLVGAPRRGRADLGLRPGLRAGGADGSCAAARSRRRGRRPSQIPPSFRIGVGRNRGRNQVSGYMRNRQLRRIGLTALVVVLGVGVWQGVAGATATGGKTAPSIQRHNANCGRHAGSRAIGTATFSRDGDELFVDVELTGADPNADYDVELWMANNNGCEFVNNMGPIGTDGTGQGSGEYTSSDRRQQEAQLLRRHHLRRVRRATTAPVPKACAPRTQGDEPARRTTTRCSSGSSRRPRQHERHRWPASPTGGRSRVPGCESRLPTSYTPPQLRQRIEKGRYE